MSYDEIFSYDKTISFLSDKINKSTVFRGEASYYPTFAPSLYRGDEQFINSFRTVATNLAMHIIEKYFIPNTKYDFKNPWFNGMPFAAQDILDRGELDYKNLAWGIEGLYQHYGFPTTWLDLTPDLNTALYFASLPSASKIGYLYYTDQLIPYDGVLIDVGKFASDMRKIITIKPSRPEIQKAFALRPYTRSNLKEKFEVIKFEKPTKITGPDLNYFPKDGLRIWLMGQLIDYYFDLLQRVEDFYDMNNEERDDSAIIAVEYAITKLELW
ncbi:MAG: FRG domain-containing protein [Bacteroidetes bacterium]|nr:FRG domain-containing protein [Bacteroidota bacterium]